MNAATNTAEKIQPAMGLRSVLRTAQKPTTETKSKTPVLDAEPDTKTLAQEVKDLKSQIDNLATMLDLKSAELFDKIAPIRIELCRREYTSSIRVPTTDGHSVLVTWTGNYIKIKPDKEDELLKIVGDKYQDYFKSKFVISAEDKSDAELYKLFEWLSPDGGETEEGLAEGQRRFAEFFTVDEVIRPTERFIHDHVGMDDPRRDELAAAGIKQYKPSVKTR